MVQKSTPKWPEYFPSVTSETFRAVAEWYYEASGKKKPKPRPVQSFGHLRAIGHAFGFGETVKLSFLEMGDLCSYLQFGLEADGL